MRLDDFIILTLHHSDRKMIAGRTLLQKTLYFLNAKIHLGFEFSPHYYGPYSSEITESIAGLSASGIIKEEIETYPPFSFGATFETRKYIYQLTEFGQKISTLAEKRNMAEAEKIRGILNEMKEAGKIDDYRSLSVAAKMHHIVKSKKRIKSSEILSEAKALNWSISEDDAKAAIKFLEDMDLIKIVKVKKS